MVRRFATICLIICAVSATACFGQDGIPLAEEHEAYGMLEALAAEGLTPGYAVEDFSMKRGLTREQAAVIVTASTDLWQNDPTAFSVNDRAILVALRKEFSFELEKAGDDRKIVADAQEIKTPPSHWAYEALSALAEKGFVPGFDPGYFRGRVLTRMELAAAAASAISYQQLNGNKFSEEDNRKIKMLRVEFEKELLVLGGQSVPVGEKPAKRKSAFSVSGSSYMRVSVSKGDKSSVSNRLSLQGGGGIFDFIYSGTLDNSGDMGVEIDFGREYVYETDRKTIGFHSNRSDPETDSYAIAGDVKNLQMGQGLLIGAASVKGIMMSAPASGGRYTAVSGDDNDGEQLYALRYENGGKNKKAEYGFNVAGTATTAGERETAYSFDIDAMLEKWRMQAEAATDRAGGRGLFFRFRNDRKKELKLKFEYRDYRDFFLSNNNAAKYSGSSGGSSENESGYLASVEWKPADKWTFLLNRDRKEERSGQSLTNLFWGAQFNPVRRWIYAVGMEKEQGGDAAESERSARVRYRGDEGASFSASWKRALLLSGFSSTSRLDLSMPVLELNGKIYYSFTRRKTNSSRTNTSRMRFNKEVDPGGTFSMSYDYSGTAAGRFDVSMTWRF